MKHKNCELVMYYLNDLKILQDLIKQSFVRDTYESSIRFISENINEFCTKIKKKFNRTLASQDGLGEDDIRDYKISAEHPQQIQILKEYLGSYLLSPETLLQNIISELHERSRVLTEENLFNPLVGIYLNNLYMLKNSFKELEMFYRNSCKKFENRFDLLVQCARELIPTNDFKQIADIILNISKSSYVLKDHLGEQVEETYHNTVEYLLQHLSNFSENADPLLQKCKLDSQETFTDLNEIYNNFIIKIIKYFGEINVKIEELFKRSRDLALEDIQKLVDDMDAIRTIPELESKTAGTYYRTVENIRGYMQELQIEAEQLLFNPLTGDFWMDDSCRS
ncbi:unnamed protein product [Didymodactylos carnosus]|uniref:Uncharacterized protein n=1 Tax=Didymodactylos carnosus TaxID=1234261 RepID=A0A8S2HQ23_9BILA|nr:unnamed protein product [Didymodactylos carnosus]CAF3674484.1 unnamed protein product [Didymodactylos carnosus]